VVVALVWLQTQRLVRLGALAIWLLLAPLPCRPTRAFNTGKKEKLVSLHKTVLFFCIQKKKSNQIKIGCEL
jgi:hypothetical protein